MKRHDAAAFDENAPLPYAREVALVCNVGMDLHSVKRSKRGPTILSLCRVERILSWTWSPGKLESQRGIDVLAQIGGSLDTEFSACYPMHGWQ